MSRRAIWRRVDALLKAKQKHDWRRAAMLKLSAHDPYDETRGGKFKYPPPDASPITPGPEGRAMSRPEKHREIACYMYWVQEGHRRPWQEIMAEMDAGTYVPVAKRTEPLPERSPDAPEAYGARGAFNFARTVEVIIPEGSDAPPSPLERD